MHGGAHSPSAIRNGGPGWDDPAKLWPGCRCSRQAPGSTRMTHVVLLGDSIFDNGAYIGGAPDVVRQLRAHLNPDGQATLCAVDGHVTTSVPGQLRNVPAGATHLVVSV